MELSGLAVPGIAGCLPSNSKELFLWMLGNHFSLSPHPLMGILALNPKMSHCGKFSRGDGEGTETTWNNVFRQYCTLHFKVAFSVQKLARII